jgi:hypothetical protein
MKRFVNDDRGYLDWLSANPGSFVINMSRSPVAGQIVLHRASCGFIKGGRSSSSYWTSHSGKLCGNREELESFVRQADCCQLRNCGICFRDPPSHISSRRVQVTHALESSEEGPDSREVILRGQEARMAWRQYRPWFWACLVVVGVSLLAGSLLWHRSMTQLIFLALGSTALSIAALIWRFGTIGFAYETSDGEATFTRRLSPLPRKIATPVLVVAGIFFILAGSPTRIGSALSPAAWDGYTVWHHGLVLTQRSQEQRMLACPTGGSSDCHLPLWQNYWNPASGVEHGGWTVPGYVARAQRIARSSAMPSVSRGRCLGRRRLGQVPEAM